MSSDAATQPQTPHARKRKLSSRPISAVSNIGDIVCIHAQGKVGRFWRVRLYRKKRAKEDEFATLCAACRDRWLANATITRPDVKKYLRDKQAKSAAATQNGGEPTGTWQPPRKGSMREAEMLCNNIDPQTGERG